MGYFYSWSLEYRSLMTCIVSVHVGPHIGPSKSHGNIGVIPKENEQNRAFEAVGVKTPEDVE